MTIMMMPNMLRHQSEYDNDDTDDGDEGDQGDDNDDDVCIPPHAETDKSEYYDDSCSHRGPHSHRQNLQQNIVKNWSNQALDCGSNCHRKVTRLQQKTKMHAQKMDLSSCKLWKDKANES